MGVNGNGKDPSSSAHKQESAMRLAYLEELLISPMNRTAALTRSYERCNMPLPKSIQAQASIIWNSESFQSLWREAIAERRERLQFRADEVLQELRDQLDVDLSDVLELGHEGDDPTKPIIMTPKVFKKLTKVQKRAIKSITRTKEGWRIELHDRIHLLELVMEHLGMKQPPVVQHTDNRQFVVVLKDAPIETEDAWTKRFSPPAE